MQNRAIRESIKNMIGENKIFSVKINKEWFKIEMHSNLAYFRNLLFKDIISFKKAEEQQEKISSIIKELKKRLIQIDLVVHLAKTIKMMQKFN